MSDTGNEQDQARQRLGLWWTGLDPTVQGMFEQIAAEQPDLVYRVISGGTVNPVEGQTLTEHLSVDLNAASNQVAVVYMNDRPSVEPAAPEVNTAFTVRWQEEVGQVAPSSHRSTAQLMNSDGNAVAEKELTGLSGAGAREVTFDGLDTEGMYYVLVTANADGVDPGQPPTEQGYRSMVGTEFIQIGAYAQAAGPSGAREAYFDLAREMLESAQMLQSEVTAERLTGAIDAASRLLGASPVDLGAQVGQLSQWRGHVEQYEAQAGRLERPAGDEIAYLQQAAAIWMNLQYGEEAFQNNGPYLVETLVALAQAATQPQ